MARTNASLVGGIIEVDASIDLSPFITIANELVTEVCVPGGYTDARLVLIETWLAAHFYAIRDPRRHTEFARGVGESFQYRVGYNFAGTTYGQQAMMLDTQGGLAKLSKQAEKGTLGMKAGATNLGVSCDPRRCCD